MQADEIRAEVGRRIATEWFYAPADPDRYPTTSMEVERLIRQGHWSAAQKAAWQRTRAQAAPRRIPKPRPPKPPLTWGERVWAGLGLIVGLVGLLLLNLVLGALFLS